MGIDVDMHADVRFEDAYWHAAHNRCVDEHLWR